MYLQALKTPPVYSYFPLKLTIQEVCPEKTCFRYFTQGIFTFKYEAVVKTIVISSNNKLYFKIQIQAYFLED